MSGPFVSAAGGTGGHLFPAQALGERIDAAAGSRVVVMTDGRGHNYRAAFPGAEIATVPAATFAGRSVIGRLVAFGVIALGRRRRRLRSSRSLRPRAVVGFGGYPSFPVMIAASHRAYPPRCTSRMPCSAASTGCSRRACQDRRVAFPSPASRRRIRAIVLDGQSRAPRSGALDTADYAPPGAGRDRSVCWCSAAARARAPFASSCPPHRRAARTLARRGSVVQQCRAPKTWKCVERRLSRERHPGRSRASSSPICRAGWRTRIS